MNGTDNVVVQTIGLTKIFRDFWRRPRVVAVRNLDLEIHPGEVFGLLGPNGSGKSTTIKMILGLLHPTRGRISIFHRPPQDVRIKSRIGYLPEESYLYPFLNARETLDYYGRLFQLPRRERQRRIDQILDMVGLTHAARRRVGEYSKGMARRIGVAQALINDPDLIILDEPTAGMDPIGTRQMKELIRRLGDMGKTVILSSHLLADVEDVCDRLAILYGGERRALGATHELLARQDLLQITVPPLAPETLRRLEQMIEELEHKRVLKIESPRDRLESFFLRIVREAQEAQVETSGVRGEGQIAAFLGEPREGREVIDRLVGAAQQVAAPAAASAEPQPEPAVDESVVASLVASGDGSPKRGRPGPTEQPPPADEPAEVDRSVIDALLEKGPGQDQPS